MFKIEWKLVNATDYKRRYLGCIYPKKRERLFYVETQKDAYRVWQHEFVDHSFISITKGVGNSTFVIMQKKTKTTKEGLASISQLIASIEAVMEINGGVDV